MKGHAMTEFPIFMREEANRVPVQQQNTPDIEGYYYNGNGETQVAFWTCHADRISQKHTHSFDEYMVCLSGRFTLYMDSKTVVLEPGDEFFIPKGTEQWGECIAGTRTIHVFGGKRITQ